VDFSLCGTAGCEVSGRTSARMTAGCEVSGQPSACVMLGFRAAFSLCDTAGCEVSGQTSARVTQLAVRFHDGLQRAWHSL
jgi:hypothetical protein